MSQEKLAEEIGVAPSHLSQIETGARQPSIGLALKISRATGISIDRLAQAGALRPRA